MTDAVVKAPDKPQVSLTPPVRRLTPVDLDSPVGEFLAQALCMIAPGAFLPTNWKGKLASFVASRTCSFLCCGHSVGLAQLEMDMMNGVYEAKGLFLIANEGGSEEECIAILREQKRWARDLDVAFYPPKKEFSSLSQSKAQLSIKAEKFEGVVLPRLEKK